MILIDGEYWIPGADELDEWIFGEEWELVPLTRQNVAELAYSMRFDPPAKVWRYHPRRPHLHFNCRCFLSPLLANAGKVELCKT